MDEVIYTVVPSMIHNCYHRIPPHEAYSWLWDFHIPLIYIGPWGASPLFLHNYWTLHRQLHRYHYF